MASDIEMADIIQRMMDDLANRGYRFEHIGAAMVGMGIAVVEINAGTTEALGLLASTRECLERGVMAGAAEVPE